MSHASIYRGIELAKLSNRINFENILFLKSNRKQYIYRNKLKIQMKPSECDMSKINHFLFI